LIHTSLARHARHARHARQGLKSLSNSKSRLKPTEIQDLRTASKY